MITTDEAIGQWKALARDMEAQRDEWATKAQAYLETLQVRADENQLLQTKVRALQAERDDVRQLLDGMTALKMEAEARIAALTEERDNALHAERIVLKQAADRIDEAEQRAERWAERWEVMTQEHEKVIHQSWTEITRLRAALEHLKAQHERHLDSDWAVPLPGWSVAHIEQALASDPDRPATEPETFYPDAMEWDTTDEPQEDDR